MTKLSDIYVQLASARGHIRHEDYLNAYFMIENAMDLVEEAMKEEEK